MDTRMKWRLALMPFALGALAVPVAGGCDTIEDAQGAVCCKEFEVGGTITADVGGSAESVVAVQAVADFAGIAHAAIDDLTTACRNIAQDLDADKANAAAAEQTEDKTEKMNAWCTLAIDAIGTVKASAGATLKIVVVPPKCEASISAKADCQAKCSGSAECDIKANPPTCEGGSLEVACKGECTAKGSAALNCEGSCGGSCSGECTAMGGVDCAGKCDGTCAAGAAGSGPQADGTCKGTCTGTCRATAPMAQCTGSCKGTCSASCTGSAMASVKCDGECKADYEPLKCTGGELKGGCKVEAKCDANCDASVKAKASCSPPSVRVDLTATGDIQAAGKLKATIEANFSVVYAFKARLEGMGKVVAVISANADVVADIKAACIVPVVAAIGTAVEDVAASGKVTVDLVAKIGG